VIGAGSSGIAAAKALHRRGIPFDCFEKSDRAGGNWVFKNSNMRRRHVASERHTMQVDYDDDLFDLRRERRRGVRRAGR
jgi:cation diffusion facilitator CzcD-associated flavoprotein CzcO